MGTEGRTRQIAISTYILSVYYSAVINAIRASLSSVNVNQDTIQSNLIVIKSECVCVGGERASVTVLGPTHDYTASPHTGREGYCGRFLIEVHIHSVCVCVQEGGGHEIKRKVFVQDRKKKKNANAPHSRHTQTGEEKKRRNFCYIDLYKKHCLELWQRLRNCTRTKGLWLLSLARLYIVACQYVTIQVIP